MLDKLEAEKTCLKSCMHAPNKTLDKVRKMRTS